MAWEYLVLRNEIAMDQDELNRLGAEGWELVGMTSHLRIGGAMVSKRMEFVCVFKRPRAN